MAVSGGIEIQSRHVVKTSASVSPARTNNEQADQSTTAITTAVTARRPSGIVRDRAARSTMAADASWRAAK